MMIRYRYVLLALAGVLVLWTAGLRWELSRSDWAAWVQALGSIGAIIGAFWLGERQLFAARKLEADKRHLDDLVKTEVLNQLFSFAVAICDEVALTLKGKVVSFERITSQLSDCIAALEVLPPLEIPGEGLALARLHLPRALKELQAALRAHVEPKSFWEAPLVQKAPPEPFMKALHEAGVISRSSRDVAVEQIRLIRKLMPVTD